MLMHGHPLGVSEIQRVLGVQATAARRHRRLLERLPEASLDRERRVLLRSTCLPQADAGPSSVPPSSGRAGNIAAVIGACFGASLSPLFERSSYEEGFKETRALAIATMSHRTYRFEHINKKFFLLRRGQDFLQRDRGELLDPVLTGLLQHRKVIVRYEDFDGKRKQYKVCPLTLLIFDQQLYVIARKEDNTFRSFLLARVLGANETKEKFDYPAEYDPEVEFAHCFGIYRGEGEPEDVRLRVSSRVRAYVKSRRWHPSQKVRSLDSGDVEVRLRVRITPELERWILGFGDAVMVLSPPRLREAIAKKLRAAARFYDEGLEPLTTPTDLGAPP
ncbi:MAG: WYL domain-containing protein [Myxococcaceae bacterium]|nr:MAG: WYL domain-containing protein [Myxococcaceae bacterium]